MAINGRERSITNAHPRQTLPKFTRRAWLAGSILFCASRSSFADDLDSIRERGNKAGLSEFKLTQSSHFRGIGNAPTTYQTEALAAAESIATEFLSHFNDKGFSLALPKKKMTVVILASPASYAAFTGEDVESAVGGHYDIEADRLVIFDFRNGGRALTTQAEIINSRTLAHETTHQLSYATGLVSSKADVPACINEGIGTYGEVWRPKGRGRIGQLNQGWLEMLRGPGGSRNWIDLNRLLTEDELFTGPETQAQCYAQSWLLTHYCLKTKNVLPKYRAYLDALKKSRDPASRPADWTTHFGPLSRFDSELRRYVRRPIGS